MHAEMAPEWSARELDILRGLADGRNNREIGEQLGIALETVRWYNKRIFDRLHVSDRKSAVARARERGLLDRYRADDTSPIVWSPICFVENDGCTIAYQVVGSGPVDVLFVHGFLSHLEVAHDQPEYVSFFESLGRHARVIIFDKRGTGLSDRSTGAPTVEDTISDMRAVLDAVAVQRAVIMGTSEGGAAAILFASMHATRTSALVLIGATARVARFGMEPSWSQPMAMLNASIENWRKHWGEPSAIDRFAPLREHDPAFRQWWGRALRSASSPSSIRAVIESASRVDVRAILPDVRTRALIVHKIGDRIVPVEAGRYLARKLPNARLVEIPGEDHIYFVDSELLLNAILPFLRAPEMEPVAETWLAIMLHMSGSGSSLSDEKHAVLNAHNAKHLRESESGWTVLFDSSHRALACARALALAGRGRCGVIALHVGECTVAEGQPLGAARAVIAQLVHGHAAGHVVLSTTLHDILNGEQLAVTPQIAAAEPGEVGAVEGWLLQVR